MALIAAWTNFLWANYRVHPKRLPEGILQIAENVRLGSGTLVPMSADGATLRTLAPLSGSSVDGSTIYAHGGDYTSSGLLLWNKDVYIVRRGDEIYFANEFTGTFRRTKISVAFPSTPEPAVDYAVGVPRPSAQFNVATLVAGSGPLETRSYIDTFVTTDGLKEGAPNSTPRTVSVAGGTTMTLGSGASFAAVPGGYSDVTLRMVYVSTSGSEYLLCAEGAASAGTLTDSLSRTTVLQSGGSISKPAWLEPLLFGVTVRRICEMWNGMMAGINMSGAGTDVAVCEPYKPWAWPAEYRVQLPQRILFLAKHGESLFAFGQAGGVYVVYGASPLSLNWKTLAEGLSACQQRPVNVSDGVLWLTQSGLFFAGDNFPVRRITDSIMYADEFALANGLGRLQFYRCWALDAETAAVYTTLVDTTFPFTRALMILRPRNVHNEGAQFRLTDYFAFDDAGGDASAGRRIVAVKNGTSYDLKYFAATASSSAALRAVTKIQRHTRPINPGYLMVVADAPNVGVKLHTYPNNVLSVIDLGTVTSHTPVKLPGGYKSQDFAVELTLAAGLNAINSSIEGVLLAEDAADFP